MYYAAISPQLQIKFLPTETNNLNLEVSPH